MTDLLRVGFTIVGSFFGPWGTLIGSFLGNLLFPAEGVKGPRLNELNVQRSTVGAPIPIVYGTAVLAGNVIWSGGLREHEHEEGGSKKGGGQTTYSYSVDVAIGICEGPISGIRRIWADADLIFDASDDATLAERLGNDQDMFDAIRALSAQLNYQLYLGTEDQMPDPTIEAGEFVGHVPAYRGLAYIVFPDFNLEKFGNRIPNFRFEVFSTGEIVDCGIYSAGRMYPWQYMINSSVHDPRNPDNNHLYRDAEGGLGTASQSYEAAIAEMNATISGAPGSPTYVCGPPQGPDSAYIRGWAYSSTPNYSQPCDAGSGSEPSLAVDRIQVTMNLNTIRADAYSCRVNESGPSDGYGCNGLWIELGAINKMAWFNAGDLSGFYALTLDDVHPTAAGLPPAAWDGRGDCQPPGEPVLNKWAAFDQELIVRRWPEPTSNYAGLTWTRVAGTFKSLRAYSDDGDNTVLSYPVDPTLATTDPNYNNEEFWTAAYQAALADPTIYPPLPDDWVYGVDYPTVAFSHATNISANSPVWRADCTAAEVECVPMATIVTDICRRAGLRTVTDVQIDVSDLTTCVTGYIIGRQMSAREALQPLRMYGLWDAVESDAKLKFVERGHALVRSLSAEDLGAHEHGSEPQSLVEVSRVQEKDLPRRVRLHFQNFEHDHEVSEQSASRLSTEAIDEQDIDLAISMDPDTAKQLAEIMLYEAHVARNSYKFQLDNSQLALEPTDCVEIPVDGQTERVRIVSVNYRIGGILEIEALRDDDGTYVSTAVASEPSPSGGGPLGGGNEPICASEVVLLDIPRQDPSHTDAGYYAAIYGLCPDYWTCAELHRSEDGGTTYQRVARTDLETTVGEVIDFGDTSDTSNVGSITVSLLEGTLSSVTAGQIAAGQNKAAVGVNGRWLIFQFQTATFDTSNQWTLSDLTLGLDGTEHLAGTTEIGDTFVLLTDNGLLRIPESADQIGVSKSFKVVSCGLSIDESTAFEFTTWGLSYQRLCPSTVISASLTEPPVSPDDGDSYLLPLDTSLSGAWADHGGEIATWFDEINNWSFCTPVPGTIVHVEDDDDDIVSGGDGTYTPGPWQRPITWYDEGSPAGDAGEIVGVDFVGNLVTATTDTDGLLQVNVEADASDIPYDNTASGLAAENVQDAIDELSGATGGGIDAIDVNYDNTASGLDADNVQDAIDEVAVFGIPQNHQAGNHTINADDNGRSIDHLSGDGVSDVYTIPSNAGDPLEIGFTFCVLNLDSNDVTVNITSDTLIMLPNGTTGSVTIAQYGHATFRKVESTTWICIGVNIS